MQITISEDGVIMLKDEEGEFLTTDEPYECAGSTEPEEEGTLELLSEYHDIFSLEEDERGQTDLIEFPIDTGDVHPIRHPLRHMPFAA